MSTVRFTIVYPSDEDDLTQEVLLEEEAAAPFLINVVGLQHPGARLNGVLAYEQTPNHWVSVGESHQLIANGNYRFTFSYDPSSVESPKDSLSKQLSLPHVAMIGANAASRSILESFGHEFVRKHAARNLCPHQFAVDDSMSSILHHFEECPGVTGSDTLLLGDKLSKKLSKKGIRLPSEGNFKDIYAVLSTKLHSTELVTTNTGLVVVPVTLPIELRRFWIRFLIANGHGVVVLGFDGKLREPERMEIETPPEKKKKSDLIEQEEEAEEKKSEPRELEESDIESPKKKKAKKRKSK